MPFPLYTPASTCIYMTAYKYYPFTTVVKIHTDEILLVLPVILNSDWGRGLVRSHTAMQLSLSTRAAKCEEPGTLL